MIRHALDGPQQPELEADTQSDLLDTLKALGIFAWRNHVATGGRMKGSSHNAGTPDILGVIRGGRLLAVEVKREIRRGQVKPSESRLREKQAKWIDGATALGAVVIIARSKGDLLLGLRAAGVIV